MSVLNTPPPPPPSSLPSLQPRSVGPFQPHSENSLLEQIKLLENSPENILNRQIVSKLKLGLQLLSKEYSTGPRLSMDEDSTMFQETELVIEILDSPPHEIVDKLFDHFYSPPQYQSSPRSIIGIDMMIPSQEEKHTKCVSKLRLLIEMWFGYNKGTTMTLNNDVSGRLESNKEVSVSLNDSSPLEVKESIDSDLKLDDGSIMSRLHPQEELAIIDKMERALINLNQSHQERLKVLNHAVCLAKAHTRARVIKAVVACINELGNYMVQRAAIIETVKGAIKAEPCFSDEWMKLYRIYQRERKADFDKNLEEFRRADRYERIVLHLYIIDVDRCYPTESQIERAKAMASIRLKKIALKKEQAEKKEQTEIMVELKSMIMNADDFSEEWLQFQIIDKQSNQKDKQSNQKGRRSYLGETVHYLRCRARLVR